MAMSMSGVRPGLLLKDGRTINLNPDWLTFFTLGALPPFWSPGPGVLDGSGGAVARLDTSQLGPIGLPLWFAMVVIDPLAPEGIAYILDTYVMRL